MSTNETAVNPAATAATANEFVGFQAVEITEKEKGPSLPDSVAHGKVVNLAALAAILTALQAPDSVTSEMNAALDGRPAGFLVVQLFPVPRAGEVETRKARKVYGAGKGIDLPFADPENNRLQLTSIMFAPIEKKTEGEAGEGSKSAGADADLDEETK